MVADATLILHPFVSAERLFATIFTILDQQKGEKANLCFFFVSEEATGLI